MEYEIIVVGTSWGGLSALHQLIAGLPRDFAIPVVAVQHRHRLEKAKTKDGRFSWRRGDKPIPYGLWLLPDHPKGRLIIVEGASAERVRGAVGA